MSSELFIELGLSEVEVKVYITLISNYVRTPEEICVLSGIETTTVVNALENLVQKKFARKIPGKVNQYIALAPPITVTAEVSTQIEKELLTIQDNVRSRWEEGKKELTTTTNSLKKSNIELVDNYVSVVSNNFKQFTSNYTSNNEKLMEKIEQQINDSNSSNEKLIEKWNNEFTAKLKDLTNEITNKVKNDIEQINSQSIASGEQINNRIGTTFTEKSQIIEQFLKQIDQNLVNTKEQTDVSTKQVSNLVQTSTDQIQSNLSQTKERQEKQIDLAVKNALQSFQEKDLTIEDKISSFQKSLIGTGQDFVSSMESSVGNSVSTLRSKIHELQQTFDNSTKKLSSSIDNSILQIKQLMDILDNITQKTQQLSSGTQKEIETTLKKQFDKLEELLSSAQKKNLEDLTKLQETIQKSQEQTAQLFSKQTEKSLNDLTTENINVINQSTEKITNWSSKIDSTITEIITEIQEKDNSNKKELIDTISEKMELIKSTHETISQNIHEKMDELSLTAKDGTEKLDNNFSQIDSKLTEWIETTQSIINNITDLISEKSSAESNSLLQTVRKITEKTEENKSNLEGLFATYTSETTSTLDSYKEKIYEKINFLDRVATEEFMSYSTSSNMLLGQMQVVTTESVGMKIDEIAAKLNEVTSKLSSSFTNSTETLSKEIDDTATFIDSELTKFTTELKTTLDSEQDKMAKDMEELLKKAADEKELRAAELKKRFDDFSDKISKESRELTEEVPNTLEEHFAQLKDEINQFERQLTGQLNALGSSLTSIKENVESRLGKRLSVGKGGFEEIAEIVKKANVEYQGLRSKVQKLIDQQIQSLDEGKDNLTKNVNTKLFESDYRIQKLLDTSSEELKNTLESSFEYSMNYISELKKKLTTIMENQKKEIDQSIHSIKGSLNSKFELVRTVQQGLIEEQNILKKQLDLTDEIRNLNQIFKNEVESAVNNLTMALESSSKSGTERIKEVINENLITEIGNVFGELRSLKRLNGLKKDIISQWDINSNYTSEELNLFKPIIEKSSNELTDQFTSLLTDFKNHIEEFQSMTTSKNSELTKTIFNQLTKIKSDMEDIINKVSITQIIDKNKESLTDILENNAQHTTTLLKKDKEKLSSVITELNSIANELNSFTDKILVLKDNLTNNVNDTLEKEHNKLKTTYDGLISNFKDNLKDSYSQTRENLNQLQELQIKLQSMINDLGAAMDSVIGEVKPSMNEIMEKTNLEMKQQIESFEKDSISTINDFTKSLDVLITDVTNMQTKFHTASKEIEKQLNGQLESFNSKIKNDLAEQTNTIKALRKTLLSDLNNSFDAIQKDANSIYPTFINYLNSLSGKIDSILEQINDINNNVIKNFKDFIDTEKQRLDERINQIFEEITTVLNENIEKVQSLVKTINDNENEEIKQEYLQLQNLLTELNNKTIDSYKQHLQQENTSIQNLIQELSQQLGENAKNQKQQIVTNSQEIKNKIEGELDSIIESIPDRITGGLEKAGKLMKLISLVQDQAIQIEPSPIEQTYLVRGQQGISVTLTSMLERTKRTLQIMAPDLSIFPIDTILSSSTRHHINILAGHVPPDKRQQLIDAGNIGLKIYPDLNIIGIARDTSEEGALGAGTGSDMQLIVTTDDELIESFKEVFRSLLPKGRNP